MFDRIPEVSRIAKLLVGMKDKPKPAGEAKPVEPSRLVAPAARPRKPASPKLSRGKLWGAQPSGELLRGANWENDPEKIVSPLIDEKGNVLAIRGAMSAGAFLGLVHWANDGPAPEWPVRGGSGSSAAASVETVLAGFSWGD